MVFARDPSYFNDQFGEDDDERAERLARRRRDRKLSDPGDVPTPPKGSEGLPIPASQDPLKRLY